MPRPVRIVLTREEEALFEKLPSTNVPGGVTKESLYAQEDPFWQLYKRQAIPPGRPIDQGAPRRERNVQ